MSSKDPETVPEHIPKYPDVEHVSKTELVRILESITEDGGHVCELVADEIPFSWPRINSDFKGFLKELEAMDFKEAWATSYNPKPSEKTKFRTFRIA